MADAWKAYRNDQGEEIVVTGELSGFTAPGVEVTKTEMRKKFGVDVRADVDTLLNAIALQRQTELSAETERSMKAYANEVARINRGGGSIGAT